MKSLSRTRYYSCLAACLAVVAAAIVISPGIGTQTGSFGWWDAWRARLGWPIDAEEIRGRRFVDVDGDGTISAEELDGFVERARNIGFRLRLPRTLLAMQVGMTLALCGAVFQTLFRNPLATPYTLGIASGGSLGALVAIRFGITATVLGISGVTAAAFLGAVGVVAAVFLVARGSRRLTSNEMLLAGVTLGLFCSAMMMLVTSISNERVTFTAVRWMMGSLDAINPSEGVALLPVLVPVWIVLIGLSRSFNQYRLGDDVAFSRGVNVARVQGVAVVACTLATAVVVARCGPIGFVGLVVPHVVVLLFGTDSRLVLPASALMGGLFLIVCDWASQVAMRAAGWATGREIGSAILPIGVVTAVTGVPIFLVLLRRRRT